MPLSNLFWLLFFSSGFFWYRTYTQSINLYLFIYLFIFSISLYICVCIWDAKSPSPPSLQLFIVLLRLLFILQFASSRFLSTLEIVTLFFLYKWSHKLLLSNNYFFHLTVSHEQDFMSVQMDCKVTILTLLVHFCSL